MKKRIIVLALAFISASINHGYSFSKTAFGLNFLSEQIFGSQVSDCIIMVVNADPDGNHVHFVKNIGLEDLDRLMKSLRLYNDVFRWDDLSPEEKTEILNSEKFIRLVEKLSGKLFNKKTSWKKLSKKNKEKIFNEIRVMRAKILSYSFIPLKISIVGGIPHIEQITFDEESRHGLYFRLEEVTKETFLFVKHGIKMAWHSGWALWHLGEIVFPHLKSLVGNMHDVDYSKGAEFPTEQDEDLLIEDNTNLEVD